ncbi:MAG: outer membrane protein assembly factor BamA [Sulfurovaceae bacterium]|nr:outer membrane protein assembly factor BamA [Sulfurovaceae bacterium]
MIKKTSLLWMSIGSMLIAQNITKIEYDGLHSLSPNTIAEISGIKVGDTLSESKIQESVKNLSDQGYFKDVRVETKDGGVIVYHFVEKLAIANAQINGYGSDEESNKLIEEMGLKRGELLDDAKMQKAKEVLQAKLAKDGIYDATVDVKTEAVGEGSVSLIFDVKKGEKVKIAKVIFNGIHALSKSDLESSLVNKEEDFLGWLPFRNNGVANLSQLENDVYRIKDTYMKYGYIDAQISKPNVQVDSTNHATIEYNIVEGNRYNVGDISIIQSVEGLDNNKLSDGLSLKKGKVFNIDKMRHDITFLQEQTANLGYAFATVVPQFAKNDSNDAVNIQFVITPGTKVTINDVIVSGNNQTQDSVVRRYIYLAPGDLFSQTDLKDSKNALGRTGFFEKYDIVPQKLSEDKMNLLVNVKEAPTGSFAIGGGYGSYEGAMINASVSDSNIFGTGIDTSFGVDYSKVSTNFNLHLANPRVWDSLYSLSLDLSKKKYDFTDYSLDQSSGSLTAGRQFLRNFYAYGGITYSDNQSEIINPDNVDPIYRLLYNDKYKKAAGILGIKFDNTDDYYTPRNGFIASLNAEIAALDGTLNEDHKLPENGGYTDFGDFVKFNAKFGAYYGLQDAIDYDLILRYKARVGYLSSTDGYVPVAERLFLGGVGSLRGYDSYSVSPTIENATGTISRVGGTKSFSNSIEASIPVSEEAKIRLTFFADYGIIGSDDFYGHSYDNINRSSAGAVVEWISPFGPINFVFAKAINPKDGDMTSSFEFSMGSKF